MIPQDAMERLAWAAGREGVDWMTWTAQESVQDAAASLDTDALKVAFDDGARAHKIEDTKWVVRYTTAPEDYDTFGTETVAKWGMYRGKPLRSVMMHPNHANYQMARYGSGLHPSWERDPKLEEIEWDAARARQKAEDEAREQRHELALAWLANLTDAELAVVYDGEWDVYESRGLCRTEVRSEKQARKAAADAAKNASVLAECLALVPDGCILVDDGQPAKQGRWGPIPGRDPDVFYNCTVSHWRPNAEVAEVHANGGRVVGSLDLIASWILERRLRIVTADDVPPEPVVKRLGRFDRIKKHVVDGKTVWTGGTYGEIQVLNEKGHKVRSKSIVEKTQRLHWGM